ncbi:MAG: ATP-binding protein [Chlamydiia bacterium]|nr:ATP-binding protein [Chlamydiia bacterium]
MIDKGFILSFQESRDLLKKRLAEKAPGRIQLLVGPRQIGKTTLLLELEKQLGEQAFYVALDSPEASLPGFWEKFWTKVEQAAEQTKTVYALLDEVQVLPNWSVLLKTQWDRIARKKWPIHIVATGSSALKLATDSRESLAGRFERMVLTHWSCSYFAKIFHLPPDKSVSIFVQTGAYPGAFLYLNDFSRWKAYVRDAIVDPAIGRDLMALAPIRKPALLRQVFAVCMEFAGQIISLQKIMGQLQDEGAIETIAYYLALLEEAFLVAALSKYSPKEIRMRASPPKIVVLSNALLAATQQNPPPNPELDPKRFGAWVENACLAYAWNAGQKVRYWREEPYEVDAVFEGSWGKWAVEVKTGRFPSSELAGLFEFVRRHPTFHPLVLCESSQLQSIEHLPVLAISWQQFLLQGITPQPA